jgi:hypothetical protein
MNRDGGIEVGNLAALKQRDGMALRFSLEL